MDAAEITKAVFELVTENRRLADENADLKRCSVRAEKFYDCPLSVDSVASLHGVSRKVVRRFISLGLIELHPDSTDAKYLVRGSVALLLDFGELRRRAKFL